MHNKINNKRINITREKLNNKLACILQIEEQSINFTKIF